MTADEEKRLARAVRKGDFDARQQMIQSNLRLVVNIAKRYANCGLPLQDLIEEGNLGLVKAVEKFDPGKNCRFSTYATWWIKQGIRRTLTDSSRIVRIPSYMREMINEYEDARAILTERLGYRPTIGEIAREMRRSQKELELSDNAVKASLHLGQILSLDSICQKKDVVADKPDATLAHRENEERLHTLLRGLDRRKRRILKMRFGLGPYGEEMTLQEISEEVKLSRERVRQIINEALDQLRQIVSRGLN